MRSFWTSCPSLTYPFGPPLLPLTRIVTLSWWALGSSPLILYGLFGGFLSLSSVPLLGKAAWGNFLMAYEAKVVSFLYFLRIWGLLLLLFSSDFVKTKFLAWVRPLKCPRCYAFSVRLYSHPQHHLYPPPQHAQGSSYHLDFPLPWRTSTINFLRSRSVVRFFRHFVTNALERTSSSSFVPRNPPSRKARAILVPAPAVPDFCHLATIFQPQLT